MLNKTINHFGGETAAYVAAWLIGKKNFLFSAAQIFKSVCFPLTESMDVREKDCVNVFGAAVDSPCPCPPSGTERACAAW